MLFKYMGFYSPTKMKKIKQRVDLLEKRINWLMKEYIETKKELLEAGCPRNTELPKFTKDFEGYEYKEPKWRC